jgi:hypothetical protein
MWAYTSTKKKWWSFSSKFEKDTDVLRGNIQIRCWRHMKLLKKKLL